MTTPASSRPIDALSATYWDAFLESNPLFATTLADPRFDGRLPDPTPEGQAAGRARYAAILAQADDLDADESEPGDAITLASLREGLLADLAFIDTGMLAWTVDPLDGIPVQLLQAGEYQPAATPAQAAALLERWRAMPAYTDAHTATLRRSLADGLVACRAPVDRVADILAELLASPDEDWPLLAPLAGAGIVGTGTIGADSEGTGTAGAGSAGAGSAGGWTTAERERFAADLRAAVADGIRPAFARLHEALTTDIRPAARPVDRPGLCHLPGGEAAYRGLARAHTSLDATPDELHRTGLAEIDRIDAELAELAGRAIGTRNLPDALAALRGDPALHFQTRDEVFAKAVAALERAAEAIPDWFGRLPAGAVRRRAHGPRTRRSTRPSPTTASRPTTARGPGSTTSIPRTRRPGRATRRRCSPTTSPSPGTTSRSPSPRSSQTCRRSGATSARPRSSRAGACTPSASATRWASIPATSIGSACSASTPGAPRAWWWTPASTRWAGRGSRPSTSCSSTPPSRPNNIANEVDRYIVMPGQALAYKTGQLEILRLRAEARERLGPAFDIRAFHDTVLGNGAVALPTLRGIVEGWTARSATGRSAKGSPTSA